MSKGLASKISCGHRAFGAALPSSKSTTRHRPVTLFMGLLSLAAGLGYKRQQTAQEDQSAQES